MPGFIYPVDYTGSSPANRISGELQLISSANFRDYKVIIPDFAPFYGNNVTVVHQDSNTPLVEGVDFYLTHLFQEATHSIGLPVYGSISIFNQNLSGTFDISYNTVGGEWPLPAHVIAEMLGGLVTGPRVTRWEQITGYPATFPPINHDHNEDDLTGMSDVVTALLAIQNAIDAAYAGGMLNFASGIEALQGILSAKSVSPATLKVVTDSLKAILRAEMVAADVTTELNIESFTQDMLGNTIFINDGFNVYKEAGTWTLHAGVGYVEGKRIKQLSNQAMVGMSYPTDVWLDVYRNSNGALQTDLVYQPVVSVTNVIRYSEEITSAHWTISGSISITPNVAYGGNGNKNIGSITFGSVNDSIFQTTDTESLTFGSTYLVSAYGRAVSGGGRISAAVGGSAPSVGYQLPTLGKRFAFPVVAGERKSLRFKLDAAGAIEIGEIQVEPHTVNHNLILNGNDLTNASWAKTNVTIAADSLVGPFPESQLMDSVNSTAVNALHEISTTVSLIAGQAYSFSMQGKSSAVGYLRLAFNNAGDSDWCEFSMDAGVVLPGTAGSTYLIRDPFVGPVLSDIGANTGYFKIECRLVPKVTGTYTFVCRLKSTAFLGAGGGLYVNNFILAAKSFSANLLLSSNDFSNSTWLPHAMNVEYDVQGTRLIPTVMSAAGDLTADSHTLQQNNIRLRPSQPYSFFIEFKADSADKAYLKLKAGASSAAINQSLEVYVNLTALTSTLYATPSTGGWVTTSSSVVAMGGGWYRAFMQGTTDATVTWGEAYFGVSNGTTQGSHVYNADGASRLLVRNASLTLSSVAPAYTDVPSHLISKYVATGYAVKTDFDGAILYPWMDNDIRHYPVKISTLSNSLTKIDRRNVIRSFGSIMKDGMANNVYKTSDFTAEPNIRYLVSNNVIAGIPPSDTIMAGDTFYFTKPIGTSFTLRVLDPGVDALYFFDALSGTSLQDIEILVDINKEVKVIFDGSAFNVIY